MQSISFLNVLVVVTAAVVAPLLLGFVPRLHLPAVVLEIVAGIIIGPSVLHVASVDSTVATLALLGLAFLLFLAGAEIEFDKIGPLIRPATLGFAVSLVLALIVSYGLQALGLVATPLFLAIVLAATALGIVVGVLTGSGQIHSTFGQLVIAGSSVSYAGTIILLAVFFSRKATGPGAQLLLVGELALLALVVVLTVRQAERWSLLSKVFQRLNSGNAQLSIRVALLLVVSFAALAERLGLEVILGAFSAGAILSLVDQDRGANHQAFREKLNAIGYGVFVPIFFVTSGLRLDIRGLLADPASLTLVPVLLAALLLVRGIPAILYRKLLGIRGAISAGLLQATSLSFIVAAVQIGLDLQLISRPFGAALVLVGLLSVLIFPFCALAIFPKAIGKADTISSPGVRAEVAHANEL